MRGDVVNRGDVVIRDARDPADIPAVRRLFEAYATSLDVDLCFQNFAHELAALPGDYAPPHGALLMAERGDAHVGCVALRPLCDEPSGKIGEVKRLYVVPDARGTRTGRALMHALIERAQVIGYDELKLDTLATMSSARALYAALGFRPCAPYYPNPLPGVGYLSLALRREA
jgi:putative acetyltransferase